MNIHVRFLNNFILNTVSTSLDSDGNLATIENTYHIQMGDTYVIDQFELSPDNKYDIHFPDSSPIKGVAFRVEGDYCSIVEPEVIAAKRVSGGCGGCGHK